MIFAVPKPDGFNNTELLLSDLKNKSGIYRIISQCNTKFYIGSAKDLYKRYRRHCVELKANRHGNSRLQNYANKYTLSSLKFEVLEFCAVPQLLTREQFYINKIGPYFNIAPIAGSRLGVKATTETKIKLSNSHKGFSPSEETRKKLSNIGRLRIQSDECKQKISRSQKGRVRTEETLKKMSEAFKGKKRTAESRKKQQLSRAVATPEIARAILILREKGVSIIKITRQLNIGRATVFNVYKRRGVYTDEYIFG